MVGLQLYVHLFGAGKSVNRTRLCAPSPLVFPPWCDGSACVWGIHTNLPSVERLGSVDALAALVCAVMVSLPQTAPGVPAAGIDLTTEELQQIGDVAGISSWLGSDEPLRTALIRVLGGSQSRFRVSIYVPATSWQATVRDFWIPQGETQRHLAALEVGHAAMVQRIARCVRRGGRSCSFSKWETGVRSSPG